MRRSWFPEPELIAPGSSDLPRTVRSNRPLPPRAVRAGRAGLLVIVAVILGRAIIDGLAPGAPPVLSGAGIDAWRGGYSRDLDFVWGEAALPTFKDAVGHSKLPGTAIECRLQIGYRSDGRVVRAVWRVHQEVEAKTGRLPSMTELDAATRSYLQTGLKLAVLPEEAAAVNDWVTERLREHESGAVGHEDSAVVGGVLLKLSVDENTRKLRVQPPELDAWFERCRNWPFRRRGR